MDKNNIQYSRYAIINTGIYSKKAFDILQEVRSYIISAIFTSEQTRLDFKLTEPYIQPNGEVVWLIDKWSRLNKIQGSIYCSTIYYKNKCDNKVFINLLVDTIREANKHLAEIPLDKRSFCNYSTIEIDCLCDILTNNTDKLKTDYSPELVMAILGQERDPARTEFEKIREEELYKLKEKFEEKTDELQENYKNEVNTTNARYNSLNSINNEINRLEEINIVKMKYSRRRNQVSDSYIQDSAKINEFYDKKLN